MTMKMLALARTGLCRYPQCSPAPERAHAYTIFVSNEKENTISVIDSEKLEVIHTIKTGNRPRGIILANEGKWVIVCASDDNTLQVFDAKTYRIREGSAVGPRSGAAHPAHVRQPALRLERGRQPRHRRRHPQRQRHHRRPGRRRARRHGHQPRRQGAGQHVGNDEHGPLHRHDDVSRTSTTCWSTTARAWREFTPDGKQVWVSAEIGGTVTVIDAATRKILGKVTFEIQGITKDAIQPMGVRITKDGKKAFVALGPANRVAVVDTATFKVEKYLLVGQRVWNLGFTPDEKLLFTTNGTSNDVSVIDVASLKVIKSIKVGRYPWGVVSAPF